MVFMGKLVTFSFYHSIDCCSIETSTAPVCEFLGSEVFCAVHKLLRLKAEYKLFIKNDRLVLDLLSSQ